MLPAFSQFHLTAQVLSFRRRLLQHTGAEIIAAIRRTENIYSQLLELSPQSTAVMRACADFLLEIANDPKRAFVSSRGSA